MMEKARARLLVLVVNVLITLLCSINSNDAEYSDQLSSLSSASHKS